MILEKYRSFEIFNFFFIMLYLESVQQVLIRYFNFHSLVRLRLSLAKHLIYLVWQ